MDAYLIYGDSSIQPQITRNFIISSNHVYVFIVLSDSLGGIIAYQNTKKINFIIIYLFLLSIVLELSHI